MPACTPNHIRSKTPAAWQRNLRCQLENRKMAVFQVFIHRSMLISPIENFSLFPEIIEASRQSQNTLMPEGRGTYAQRVVPIHARQILVDILYRGAHHEIWLAIRIFQFRHISQAFADIRRIDRPPSSLHVARCHEIAEIRVVDAAAERALQRMARSKLVLDAQRMFPLLFCLN